MSSSCNKRTKQRRLCSNALSNQLHVERLSYRPPRSTAVRHKFYRCLWVPLNYANFAFDFPGVLYRIGCCNFLLSVRKTCKYIIIYSMNSTQQRETCACVPYATRFFLYLGKLLAQTLCRSCLPRCNNILLYYSFILLLAVILH